MINKTVRVNFSADAEARPVAMLVQIASQFESKIFIVENAKKINAKSIMGMMSMGFGRGEELTVEAEGTDEEKAIDTIVNYIESGSLA
ncbi:MAG: HPr family phosphocarrier protein [Clostridium sp.]|nr:HPr family phosphocarrier protein [Clostridium sp.]MCM1398390.1 HPr family phosphocarrier protein [Clostridium sp.]MCM1458945.1 HPr family phosphocarrier protein [Bacteroides sp.]